ncbi:DUF4011 domain-containing protein [Ornithinimicrobium faecis]|uniref:DUF4011 domain-containing protein n=1 Tax=Ornithinimicrobium faecis TaxID=2934158 RepID=UPI002119685A|nr:DUF4011 domain-containing protein [Ornithinimicrobium sp. HY1745]
MNQPVDAQGPRVDATSDEERPTALETAQDAWRSELAELGGRNTLMWHRELPTGTIDLTVAHPGGVAKLLAGHNTLLSELVRESMALTEARRRVSAIRAKGVELQREYGLSTLFLAVGMASWQLRRAPIPPRAPVLLRGARIRPTDASRRDFVLRLDSDVIFNPALEHYLRGERGIELDGHELARASSGRHGFDPRPTYDRLEALCGGLSEFGIGPQLVLSTYPLAKLPLVAELAGPVETLARRPLLVSLAEAQEKSGKDVAPAKGHRPRAATVLAVDRAQRDVLNVLAQGQSVLLDAEPGTGRTQTIVNAVARAVGGGGSVLVAAEQRRALEDVQERLRSIGLGDLALDLRETAAAARRAGATLVDALDRHQSEQPMTSDSAAPVVTEDPLVVLAEHQEHLHGRREPWGVTLAETHEVLARLAALERSPASHVRLEGDVLAGLTPDSMSEIREALTRAVSAGAWKRRAEDPWFGAQITTDQDAERAAALVADHVGGRFSQAREDVNALAKAVGLPAPVNLQQWNRIFELLRQVRDTLDVFTPEVYESPLEDLVRATTKQPRGSADKLSTVARTRLRRQARSLLRPGTPPPDVGDRLAHALQERSEWESLAGRAARPSTPRGWEEAAAEFEGIHSDLTWLAEVLQTTTHGREFETTHLDLVLERLVRLDAQADRLPVVAAVHGDLQPLRDRGLGRLVDDLAQRGVAHDDVEAEADLVFWASVHDQMARQTPQATGAELHGVVALLERQEEARAEAARSAVVHAARDRVSAVLAAHPDQADALRAVVEAGPPLRTIDLIQAAPDLVQALRPCWLTSPLTVPATIPTDTELDLIVIEEAQQIPLAHAVPALTRGATVLVAGDSGGLPGLPVAGVADATQDPAPAGGESLLSSASRVLPVRHLDTHYRSLDDRMLPRRPGSAVTGYPGVLRQSRIAVVEAEGKDEAITRMVDIVLDHARRSPRHSLGVVVDDAALVPHAETLLWERVAGEADLVASFREDVAEPFVLSTVERAAGDVRDRLVLVLTGRDQLSQAWGAAALNASRRSIVVVSDRPLGDLPASPGLDLVRATVARAAVDPEQQEPAPRDPAPQDSAPQDPAPQAPALVADLAQRLRAENLTVRLGFGGGPQRIELVVDDPDDRNRPLLAIDTDAHPDPDGPDADRLYNRILHLRQLGWTPVQVWTTDVFRDPAREVARLVDLARRASAQRQR